MDTYTRDMLDRLNDDRRERAVRLLIRTRRAYREARDTLGQNRAPGSAGGESRRPAPGPRAPVPAGHLDSIVDADDILAGWAVNLRDDRPELRPVGRHRGDKVAGWLIDHADHLAAARWFGDCMDEVSEVVTSLERMVEPPAPLPPEPVPLRAVDENVRERVLLPKDVVTVLTAAEVFVTEGHIRRWREAGWLTPAGKNRRGRLIYRVGDVFDLAMRSVVSTAA